MMGYHDMDSKVSGADEIDIVYSALDEIMTEAVKENWAYAVKNDVNFRDACLGNAINKVYQHYKVCGINWASNAPNNLIKKQIIKSIMKNEKLWKKYN